MIRGNCNHMDEQQMNRKVEISENLFKRLEKHAVGFDTPENVIERVVNFYEKKNKSAKGLVVHRLIEEAKGLEIVFYPSDEDSFQKELLKLKSDPRVAWILLTKIDGTQELRKWKATKITEDSNVLGNLRSGYLRGWRQKGIVKAEIAINKQDLQGTDND